MRKIKMCFDDYLINETHFKPVGNSKKDTTDVFQQRTRDA
jgi:hypothetical protein